MSKAKLKWLKKMLDKHWTQEEQEVMLKRLLRK